MRPTPLRALTELVGGAATGEASVTGATHASTEVRPGDLYAALPGSRRHGAEFIGAQTGLGYIAVSAVQFGLLDRVAVIGIVFILYAMVSLVIFELLSRLVISYFLAPSVHVDLGDPDSARRFLRTYILPAFEASLRS